LVKHHQPVRLVKWERMEQHTVDDAKDCSRGTDRERERGDRSKRKPRISPQSPCSIAGVLHDRIDRKAKIHVHYLHIFFRMGGLTEGKLYKFEKVTAKSSGT